MYHWYRMFNSENKTYGNDQTLIAVLPVKGNISSRQLRCCWLCSTEQEYPNIMMKGLSWRHSLCRWFVERKTKKMAKAFSFQLWPAVFDAVNWFDFQVFFAGTRQMLVPQWKERQEASCHGSLSKAERLSSTKTAPKGRLSSVLTSGPATTVILTSEYQNAEVRKKCRQTEVESEISRSVSLFRLLLLLLLLVDRSYFSTTESFLNINSSLSAPTKSEFTIFLNIFDIHLEHLVDR